MNPSTSQQPQTQPSQQMQSSQSSNEQSASLSLKIGAAIFDVVFLFISLSLFFTILHFLIDQFVYPLTTLNLPQL